MEELIKNSKLSQNIVENNFIENKDYKIFYPLLGSYRKTNFSIWRSWLNKETFKNVSFIILSRRNQIKLNLYLINL